MKTLRDYQVDIANKGYEILKEFGIVYLALEVRLGKSATALDICRQMNAKRVLFITKKLAFKSIEEDYSDFGYSQSFDLTIINKESLHKLENNEFDLVVVIS